MESTSNPRPLSSLTDSDLKQYLNDCLRTFSQTNNAEIAASVRREVSAAVAPIQTCQKEIAADLASTKSKVSEIAQDHADTKVRVDDLHKQMQSFRQQLGQNPQYPPLPLSNRDPQPTPVHHLSVPQLLTSQPPQHSPQTRTPEQVVQNVVSLAKKTLGFSPITYEDINFLKNKHSIDDDQEAMKLSIIEFLNYEMKIPKSITDLIFIKRTFSPAKQPNGWKTLYAEFDTISTSDLINQYVTNLLPGRSVSIYVPHSLFPRFSAVRDIEHSYRHGDKKFKTKVKYGTSDFVLLIKPRDTQAPWSYVSLSSLPPIVLSPFNGNPPSSPPPGRCRLPSSKRSRSGSSDSESSRVNKTKLDIPALHTDADDSDETTANLAGDENGTNRTAPIQSTPSLHTEHNGALHPLASVGLSPSRSQNTLNC